MSPQPQRVLPRVSRLEIADPADELVFRSGAAHQPRTARSRPQSNARYVHFPRRSSHPLTPSPYSNTWSSSSFLGACTSTRQSLPRMSPQPQLRPCPAVGRQTRSLLLLLLLPLPSPLPDNLSPLVQPTLDDYFAPSSLQSSQSHFVGNQAATATSPNLLSFDQLAPHTPTKHSLRSSQSQTRLAQQQQQQQQQEFINRAARARSLSTTSSQHSFSPFGFPQYSPSSSQNQLYRSGPLPQDQVTCSPFSVPQSPIL